MHHYLIVIKTDLGYDRIFACASNPEIALEGLTVIPAFKQMINVICSIEEIPAAFDRLLTAYYSTN